MKGHSQNPVKSADEFENEDVFVMIVFISFQARFSSEEATSETWP